MASPINGNIILPYRDKYSRIASKLLPNTTPKYINILFHIRALIADRTTVFLKSKSDKPAKKEMTALVPDKNLLAIIK